MFVRCFVMPSGIRILADLFVCKIRIDSIALDNVLSTGTKALHKNLRACPKWVGSSILSGCNVAHATLVINLLFDIGVLALAFSL